MAEVFDGTSLFQTASTRLSNKMAGDAQVLRVNRVDSPEFKMNKGYKSDCPFEVDVIVTVNRMVGQIEVLEVPRTITQIKPKQDTFLRKSVPTFSYYYYSEMITGKYGDDEYLSMVQFDVPKEMPEGHKITWEKAILRIPKRDRAFVDMSLHAIDTTWHDNNVTWKTHPEVGAKVVDGYTVPGELDYVCFDLTEYYRDVVMEGKKDFGFYIISNKDKVSMTTTESDKPPLLTIEYKDFTLMNLLDTCDFEGWMAPLYNSDSPEFEVSTYGANIPNDSPVFEVLLDKGPDKGFELMLHPHSDFAFSFSVANDGSEETEFEMLLNKGPNRTFELNLRQVSQSEFDYGMYQIKKAFQDFDYGMYQIKAFDKEVEAMYGYASDCEFEVDLIAIKDKKFELNLWFMSESEFDSDAIIFYPIDHEFDAVISKDTMDFEYSVTGWSEVEFEYNMVHGGESECEFEMVLFKQEEELHPFEYKLATTSYQDIEGMTGYKSESSFDMNLLKRIELDKSFESKLGVISDHEFDGGIYITRPSDNQFELILSKDTLPFEMVLNKSGETTSEYEANLLVFKEVEFDYGFMYMSQKDLECVLNFESISEIDFAYMKGYKSEIGFEATIAVYREQEFESLIVTPLDKPFEMNLRQRSEVDFETRLLQLKEKEFELNLYFKREAKFELDLAFMSEQTFDTKIGDQQAIAFESLLGNFMDKTFNMEMGHQSLSPEFEGTRHPASYIDFEMLLESNHFEGYGFIM